MRKLLVLACCLSAALAAGAALLGSVELVEPAENEVTQGTLWRGQPGVSESVARIMERQSRGRASEPAPDRESDQVRPKRSRLANPASPRVSQWPPSGSQAVSLPEPLSFHTIGTSFKAVTYHEALRDPPDTIGAVGPTQILVVVNGRVRVFSRSGELGPLDVDLTVFFASVNGGLLSWDPQVRYDRLSQRWFLTALNDGLPNHILIAASSGPVITGSTSFTFFRFRQDEVTPQGHTDGWADYDGLGVDRFSLYIGVDIGSAFPNVEFLGTDGFVVNKADLLNGILTVSVFRGMYPGGNGNQAGPDDPRGVSNDDPSATAGYFIGPDFARFGRLILRRITYPGGIPAISNNIILTVPETNFPLDVPHLGMNAQNGLDPEDDRLFIATIFTNKITGARSLWTAHNIQVDENGVASISGQRDGSRWYEIGNLTSGPVLIQSGTIFDPSYFPRYFFIPSAAMSGQGHATIGFSTAGSMFYVDAGAVGRLAGDPLGTTRPFDLLTSSDTAYNRWPTVTQPWGDYSQTQVDPNDDMTFWTFQEYCESTNSWGVRVVELKAPPPATPSLATPSSLCPGIASSQITLTGASVSGSGFFDPGPDTGGPGFANHISATVTGGVSVTGVLFDSPTQVRLTVSTAGASSGGQDITITNPDGQWTTGSALLTIAPQPTTPAAGNNGPLCAGGTLQLTASPVAGASYSWSGPNGFTSVQQNPFIPNVTGASSGSYQVTVTTGGCSSPAASTSVTVLSGGSACSDGNACTLGETCQAGICQGGVPPDADLDGHVAAACGGNDCDDASALVWLVPLEVTNLSVAAGNPTDLGWDTQGSSAGPGTIYDLVSGTLGGSGGNGFSSGICLQSSGATSYQDLQPEPVPGEAIWYLSKARNSCGSGTYGSVLRDSTVPACP